MRTMISLITCSFGTPRALLAVLALMFMSVSAFADVKIRLAPDVITAVNEQNLIVLDIRRPSEWAQTGVASIAWPVSMHDAKFGANLSAIFARFPNSEVALICATGGRTSYVANILEKNGITNISDISEGMMGNGKNPGWIARGLPIIDSSTALDNFNAAMTAQ